MMLLPWSLRVVALLLFTGSVFSLVRQSDAAQLPLGAKAESQFMPDSDLGVSCGACHREPLPDAKTRGSDKFVLLREYTYWNQHDLHRRAFDGLSSPLGQRMSVLLYGNSEAVTKKASCLVCHATDTEPATPLAAKTASQFGCELGVNCQACHGPASKWLAEHFKLSWREVHGTDKQSKFGLTNLRDPAVRAKTCVACHVGNAVEGKCVTHEMYAAGHPPLPAFELATFSRDEPRHWRAPSEVPVITSLESDKARERFAYRKGEGESARLVAVGAIECMKETVRLLSFEPDPKNPEESLDFTHFNCAACHHDLRMPSDRQKNGFPGAPGRPVPRTWPAWLARVVIKNAADLNHPEAAKLGTEFETRLVALRAAFDARPFGDKPKVLEAAKQLAATCDDLLKLVDSVDYNEAAAWKLLTAIADQAAEAGAGGARKDFLDADGAYQLARAFTAIYTDLAGSAYDRAEIPSGPASLDKLAADPKGLSALLVKLNAITPVAMREKYANGRTVEGLLPDHIAFLIQGSLDSRLKTYYGYDPTAFRQVFTEIRKKLGQ